MRRLANAETFVVMTDDHTYQVILDQISYNTAPTYKAFIVMQNDVCRNATTVNISVSNPQVIPVYSFKGHLFPLQQEAEWLPCHSCLRVRAGHLS